MICHSNLSQLSDELYDIARLILICRNNITLMRHMIGEIELYPISVSLEELDKLSNKIHIISQILKTFNYGKF